MSKVKKLMAMTMAAVTAFGMSVTAYALPKETSATITIDNAGSGALFNNVQIVVANPKTSTGWDIVDAYNNYFFTEFDYGTVATENVEATEQVILEGMIFEATEGDAGTEIENFDAKYADALDAISATIPAPHPADPETETEQVGSGSPLTVNSAGVYVIRGYEEGYTYGTMAAYVSFGPYDATTGAPTDLVDTKVEAKRVPTTTTKSADDEDKVVQIGRTVTYTVTSTVPYFAPTESDSAEYWFKDTIECAVYSTVEKQIEGENKNVVEVRVVAGAYDHTFDVKPEDIAATGTEPAKQTISLDLTDILTADGNNAHANETITITYKAEVTDTYTENTASTGKGENNNDFGYSTEKLFTGDVTMTKYAEDGTTTLSGAGFEVRKVGDATGTSLTFTKVSDGVYKYDPEGTETEVFTGTEGTVTLQGLDLGGYEFKETTAPEGYTINQETRVAVVTLAEGVEVATEDSHVVDGSTSITDTKLSSLPSTGGIGTTIFTIGGCVIMVTAAGLYFATRKKEHNA